jgi:hypothetical protein
MGARGGAVVEALRYKPEGRGSIPDGVIGIFHWHNPSGRTVAVGSTQPLTEMSPGTLRACNVIALPLLLVYVV